MRLYRYEIARESGMQCTEGCIVDCVVECGMLSQAEGMASGIKGGQRRSKRIVRTIHACWQKGLVFDGRELRKV